MIKIPPVKNIKDIFFDEEKCISFLKEIDVIIQPNECSHCGGKIKETKKLFKCTQTQCRKSKSIFENTFFKKSHLKCNEVMYLGYLWLTKCTNQTIQMQTGHCRETIAAYKLYFRQLITDMIEPDDKIIGGNGIIIEVDETKIGKRKHNRGHIVEGAWVIVGVERTAERLVFAEVVERRDAETIKDVFERHVAIGSILYTDEWKAYETVARHLRLEHHTVKHKSFFKDTITGVHTNTVEGTNHAIKRVIPIRNRTKINIPSHIFEFTWRRKNATDLWGAFKFALIEVGYNRLETFDLNEQEIQYIEDNVE